MVADRISEVFGTAARQWPERALFADPDAPERTFAEAAADVAAAAGRLAAAGVGAGHRIGLSMGNGQAFFTHLLALNSLGASALPMAADALAADRAAQLLDACVAAVIAGPDQIAGFAHAPLPAGTPDAPPAVRGPAAAWPDEAAVLFTSGTTGRPKRCVLSNRYFVNIGRHYAGIGGLCAFRPAGDRILTPLPVTHINALACSFMVALETGSALIALDRFRASTWWETVRDAQATVVHYLGVMPAILLTHAPSPQDREHALRFGFGAGVDPRHRAAFEERFGFPLVEAWAMTETGAGAWVTAAHEPRHVGARCIGRPGPEMAHRIVRDGGAIVVPDEPGELLVRASGPDGRSGFFSGYDGDPDATEAAWDGGWFHTGDIVCRGRDGSLFFVDRLKNIIRRSGENIAAIEVEAALLTHPGVAACAVLPVEDELRGEEVMALIVPAGTVPDPTDLHDHAAAVLPYFKAPGWIGVVGALPTTGSQKLQRGAVREIGRAMVATGQAHDLRDRKRRR